MQRLNESELKGVKVNLKVLDLVIMLECGTDPRTIKKYHKILNKLDLIVLRGKKILFTRKNNLF